MATANENYGREFTRELPVALDDRELQVYGKMLAEKVKEVELLEERKKAETNSWASKIKIANAEIKRIADARAKGEELRPVMCRERIKGNVIEIVRVDRGEVVDTRPAELRDLQTSLPGTGVPEIPTELPDGSGPTEHNGEDVVSSSGDTVHVMPDDEDHSDDRICDGCGEPVADDEPTEDYNGSTMHRECADEKREATNAPGEDVTVPEDEDAKIDRMLAEREAAMEDPPLTQREKDIAQRDKEIAEDKAAKPKRERSKKANTKRRK